MPLRAACPLAVLLLLGAVAPASAQNRVKASSCTAADSLLGPLTPRQARRSVTAAYFARSDTTRMFSAEDGDTPVSVRIAVPGHTPLTMRPAAYLQLLVAYYLTDDAAAHDVSVFMTSDDTARVSIGAPIIHPLTGTVPRNMMPSEWPIEVPLSSALFLQLARAQTVTFSWKGKALKASLDNIAAINATYRLALCIEAKTAR